jgi:hypothetical protein
MEKKSNGPVTDPRTWSPGAIVALCALIVIVSFLFWQLGFNYGSRKSNDLLLTSPDANSEVIQLRAQLQEARTFEDTVISVVLAAFAAGFTVLVLVNIGIVVIAQRDYERDRDYMKVTLIDEAKQLERSLATIVANQIKKGDETLRNQISEANKKFDAQLGTLSGRIDTLFESANITFQSINSLQAENLEDSARKSEVEGCFLDAAEQFFRLARMNVDGGTGYMAGFRITDGIRNLRNYQPSNAVFGVRDKLDNMTENLSHVAAAPLHDKRMPARIDTALARIQNIRDALPPETDWADVLAGMPATSPGAYYDGHERRRRQQPPKRQPTARRPNRH